MIDLPIALALMVVAWCAWQQPWIGVLGLVFAGVMVPQGYAKGWLESAPVYLWLLALVIASTARRFIAERRWPSVPFWDWRFAIGGLLAVQMVLTTWLGINPWVGWGKLAEIAKILPLLALLILLIDNEKKLRYLLMTIAISIAAVAIKGGYFAFFMGFRERVYGPPGSQYQDNNEFAVATAMVIPLIVLWMRHVHDRWLFRFLAGLIALVSASTLSSWSRGGLLCLATVVALLVLNSARKWLAGTLLTITALTIALTMPDAWIARMATLTDPGAEGSAAARLAVWRLGIDYALQHPWFGGGLGSGIYLTLPTGAPLAWHSAYVGMAVDHGLVGLLLWCALLFGTLVELSLIIHRKSSRGAGDGPYQAAMLRASLAAYAVGSAFLSISYWELLYVMIVAALLTIRLSKTLTLGTE